ncbi:hypothetical protein BGZ65_006010 [Modicella reniformis]|uniref:Yeast cell wall synthesis Kre9/Knh1-like N-terminal domain-containing protein n=1 Tax=Modicella reniformis TaxID=1440133 RepID=A0A9P6M2M9_9FUNG|nr:hypothetical protein BGZ65_006010 [Modicella reniformis]
MMALARADMLSISSPSKGTTWKVGDTVFLQWKGNCASMGKLSTKKVDVNLMSGPLTALRFVAKLASIDCSGTNTRKEFIVPAEESGDYSLQVQTEPQPSYSNIFMIEKNGAGGIMKNTASDDGDSLTEMDLPPYKSDSSSLKNVESTATASAVALAVIFVEAQLL